MQGLAFLDIHKQAIFKNGVFSVPCKLFSPTATLGDTALDSDLKCLFNFIGLTVNAETGMGIVGDSAQATLNMADVTIGTPEKGWKITVYVYSLGEFMNFAVDSVAPDRTNGQYLLSLSAIKETGTGKKVYRQGLGGL